jgi:hypothetical protein
VSPATQQLVLRCATRSHLTVCFPQPHKPVQTPNASSRVTPLPAELIARVLTLRHAIHMKASLCWLGKSKHLWIISTCSFVVGVCEVIFSDFGTTGSCVYTECADIMSQEVCVANHCNSAQLSDGTIMCSDPGSGELEVPFPSYLLQCIWSTHFDTVVIPCYAYSTYPSDCQNINGCAYDSTNMACYNQTGQCRRTQRSCCLTHAPT